MRIISQDTTTYNYCFRHIGNHFSWQEIFISCIFLRFIKREDFSANDFSLFTIWPGPSVEKHSFTLINFYSTRVTKLLRHRMTPFS